MTPCADSCSTHCLTEQGEWMPVALGEKKGDEGEKYNFFWIKCKFPQCMCSFPPLKSTNFYQIFPEPNLIPSSLPCPFLWRPWMYAHIPVFICCVCAFYFSKLIDECDILCYFIFWRSLPAKTLWKIAVCSCSSLTAGCPMESEPCDFLQRLRVWQRWQTCSEIKDNYNF